MLLQLTKLKNKRVQSVPKCLPFKSIKCLIQFDNASDEMYDEVVSIFANNFNFTYTKNINYFLHLVSDKLIVINYLFQVLKLLCTSN